MGDGEYRRMRIAEAILDVKVEEIGNEWFLYSFTRNDTFDRSFIELVRCKDCVHMHTVANSDFIQCDRVGRRHRPDWYCADGERTKEDI